MIMFTIRASTSPNSKGSECRITRMIWYFFWFSHMFTQNNPKSFKEGADKLFLQILRVSRNIISLFLVTIVKQH